MTSGQIVCVILGALIGFAASLYLAFRLRGLPKGMFAVIPGAMTLLAVVGTWWLGRRLFPPARRPGQRCVKCGYDLRACAEPRCPECGTPFDWGAVKIRMLPPTEPRLPPGGDEPQ